MLPIHLSLRLENGQAIALQMLAHSTADALLAAQDLYGEQLRGASVRPLRAPGLVGQVGQPARVAANDAAFGEVRA